MIEAWKTEAVGTQLVQRVAGRLPGLYMIEVDETGERRFFYWRQQAPAREIFGNGGTSDLCNALLQYEWLYLSGISLSLYGERGRERLFDRCASSASRAERSRSTATTARAHWPSVECAARNPRSTGADRPWCSPAWRTRPASTMSLVRKRLCDLIHGLGPAPLSSSRACRAAWSRSTGASPRSSAQGCEDRRRHRRR